MSTLTSRHVRANGLSLHLLHRAPDAHVALREPVLLLHGYLDLARSFTVLIDALAAAGHAVYAPDFRGHGDSDRAPEGSYYHFADYLADTVGVLDALSLERPHVVAHSMGGSVAVMLAGVCPTRVRSLALLEGVGPPPMPHDVAPDRTLAWLEGVAKIRARGERRMASLDEAIKRMRVSHPGLSSEVLAPMADVATRITDDGGRVFRFDPLHQSTSPGRFDAEAFEAFIARITCPTLLVWGHDPAVLEYWVERSARFRDARSHVIADAGHMLHWTRPHETARVLSDFFAAQEFQLPSTEVLRG